MPFAEHAVYDGVLSTRGGPSPLVSLFRETGVRDDQPMRARVEHWRATDGREMFLLTYKGAKRRFICTPKAVFAIDHLTNRVTLTVPELGMSYCEWGFLLPKRASPACYASVPAKYLSRKCGTELGCVPAVVQVNQAVPVGVTQTEEGNLVRGPAFNERPGYGVRFRASTVADPWPKSIAFSDDTPGSLAKADWTLTNRDSMVKVSFDAKSYLQPSYYLTLQYYETSISPAISVDQPNPWATFRRERAKSEALATREKKTMVDLINFLPKIILGTGFGLLGLAYALHRRKNARGKAS